LQMAVSSQFIAQAFELTGTAAKRRWDTIAELLTRAGTDPNWRRPRPSWINYGAGSVSPLLGIQTVPIARRWQLK
jgi:hypothetical protein